MKELGQLWGSKNASCNIYPSNIYLNKLNVPQILEKVVAKAL